MVKTNDLYILGLNCYDHDVSACLLRNGEIVVAIAKERITRIKHDPGFHAEVVDYCLETAGIELDDVDLVVRNSYILPVEKMEQRLAYRDWPLYLDYPERQRALESPLFLPESERVVSVSHHLSHAYSAFAASPFQEGAIMVVDGVGSYAQDVTEEIPSVDSGAPPLARESESYYRFEGTRIDTLKKVFMNPAPGFLLDDFFVMPGLGALYSRVSFYVFGDWNKCGEVMGLAAYGRAGVCPPLLSLENGRIDVPDWSADRCHPWLGASDRIWEESPDRQEWEDLAWRVQDDTERVLLERAHWLYETTGSKNLCMAGGVALNCVANGRIVRETPFENVWIQPAAGDDGIAIGCAYYGHLALRKQPRTFVMRDAYLGRDYVDTPEEGEALDPWPIRLATHQTQPLDVTQDTARLLAEGKVVGWFQGRSEFGPRALGNRSILTDPREARMKDHVNARVKFRQEFRPFAPAVLAERANEIFVGDHESPFMLLASDVRPQWRERVAAIVHVDGTARVQTVRREDNPRYYDLIRAFGELTGVPVLLNTSFNIKGEPIVETPTDAMDCFLNTGIDVLVLHDVVCRKRWTFRGIRPLIGFYSRMRKNLRYRRWLEHLAQQYLEG